MKMAYEIDADDKAEFVNLIYEGFRCHEAAKQLGSTGTQFRRVRNPRSESYDADFAKAVEEALASDEHQRNYLERIRDARDMLIEDGNVKMIEKESYAHDPLWATMRHQNFNVNIDILARTLPGLSREQLEAIAEAERKRIEDERPALKALPRPE